MHAFHRFSAFLCAQILFSSFAFAEEFAARCVDVADGDTITVLQDGFEKVEIRLEGVDCPEKGDDWWETAKSYTAALVLDRLVIVRTKETDRHQRIVSRIVTDGLDVSTALLLAGLCRVYREFTDDPLLLRAEEAARSAGIGIWSGDAKARSLPAQLRLYHGNRESKIFHASGCRYYNCKNCTVMFDSAGAARAAGFKAHEECVEQ